MASSLPIVPGNLCQNCKEYAVSTHCLDCKMAYCDNCMKTHDANDIIRTHRRHRVDALHERRVCTHKHAHHCITKQPQLCTRHPGKFKTKTCSKCDIRFCEDCYRKHIKQKGCRRRKETKELTLAEPTAPQTPSISDIVDDALECHGHSMRAVGHGLLAHILNVTKVENIDARDLRVRLQAFIYILSDKVAANQELFELVASGRKHKGPHDLHIERQLILNEQETVLAIAEFALNERSAPKILSNTFINIFRRLAELIQAEAYFHGPSILVHCPLSSMVTDPGYKPFIADNENISKFVTLIRSIQLPLELRIRAETETKRLIDEQVRELEQNKEVKTRDEKYRRINESKEVIVVKLKPVAEAVLKGMNEFLLKRKELAEFLLRTKRRPELAMEDDLVSDDDFSSAPEDGDGDEEEEVTLRTDKAIKANSNNTSNETADVTTAAATTATAAENDSERKKEKKRRSIPEDIRRRARKQRREAEKKHRAIHPSTSSTIAHTIMLAVKDLARPEEPEEGESFSTVTSPQKEDAPDDAASSTQKQVLALENGSQSGVGIESKGKHVESKKKDENKGIQNANKGSGACQGISDETEAAKAQAAPLTNGHRPVERPTDKISTDAPRLHSLSSSKDVPPSDKISTEVTSKNSSPSGAQTKVSNKISTEMVSKSSPSNKKELLNDKTSTEVPPSNNKELPNDKTSTKAPPGIPLTTGKKTQSVEKSSICTKATSNNTSPAENSIKSSDKTPRETTSSPENKIHSNDKTSTEVKSADSKAQSGDKPPMAVTPKSSPASNSGGVADDKSSTEVTAVNLPSHSDKNASSDKLSTDTTSVKSPSRRKSKDLSTKPIGSGLFSKMCSYRIDQLCRGEIRRTSEIRLNDGYRCAYMTEMWRDLWLVCPDNRKLLAFKYNGTFQCEVLLPATLHTPKSVAQLSSTVACIVAEEGIFTMDISQDGPDMFKCLTKGKFGAMCVANDVAYIMLLNMPTLVKVTHDMKKFDLQKKAAQNNCVTLKPCPAFKPNDSICVTSDRIYIYNDELRVLYGFRMDGRADSHYNYENSAAICGFIEGFLVISEFHEKHADLIIHNLATLDRLKVSPVPTETKATFCVCGRKRSLWFACDSLVIHFVFDKNAFQ